MRALVGGQRLSSLLVGTVALAIVANSYELLCTAGFPMVYTRALTLRQLSTGAYYFYLALYNLIYVIPLLIIVLAFTWTLGSRKLGEREGRLLKLLSGVMMVGLGLLLLFGTGAVIAVLSRGLERCRQRVIGHRHRTGADRLGGGGGALPLPERFAHVAPQ